MSTSLKRGTRLVRRRTGVLREIKGFTQKPDGIRRARLVDPWEGLPETKVRVDQILKTYRPV